MYKQTYKVLEFKSIEPFYSQEKDGTKPFTVRLRDYHDSRFRALAQFDLGWPWLVKITNPATGDYFYRKLLMVRYFPGPEWLGKPALDNWVIIYLGAFLPEE